MTLLTKFGVRNFKGIREADLELRPITILIGANGSGKSTIAQALLLLRQSLDRNDLVPSGHCVRLGEDSDLFFNRDLTNPIEFLLEGERAGSSYREEIKVGNGRNRITFSAKFSTPFGIIVSKENTVTSPEISDGSFKITIGPTDRFSGPFTITSVTPGQKTPEEVKTIRNILSEISSMIQSDLTPIWFVSSIRGTLMPFHPLQDLARNNLAFPTDIELEKRNTDWISTLAYNPALLARLSRWCVQILQTPLEYRLAQRKQIILERVRQRTNRLRPEEETPKVNIVNDGFGLNQLSFLLTQLALAPPESIVAIEEPEIHLHPRAQTKLMEVLVEDVLQTRKTLLITTHSEHIVYQALIMVGLRKLKPDQLALYHFLEDPDGCRGRKLPFSPQGRLEKGLPDFFEANVEQFKSYIDILAGTKGEDDS